jgi:hypothetical protein
MFCPNCSQAFNARDSYKCPQCQFELGGNFSPVKMASGFLSSRGTQTRRRTMDLPRVEAGIHKGLMLLFIAAGFFPIYLVLGSLYPANGGLVKGYRSADLFDKGGKAILFTLLAAGILRIAYALIVDRRDAMREELGS